MLSYVDKLAVIGVPTLWFLSFSLSTSMLTQTDPVMSYVMFYYIYINQIEELCI